MYAVHAGMDCLPDLEVLSLRCGRGVSLLAPSIQTMNTRTAGGVRGRPSLSLSEGSRVMEAQSALNVGKSGGLVDQPAFLPMVAWFSGTSGDMIKTAIQLAISLNLFQVRNAPVSTFVIPDVQVRSPVLW